MTIFKMEKIPPGISTQDPELAKRLDPRGRRTPPGQLSSRDDAVSARPSPGPAENLTCTTWSRKTWSPLTIEASAMAKVPLAGTNWIPGTGKF